MRFRTAATTKERLILATEALVAKHGIGSVSAREIAKHANLRNTCSVQYHFGSMTALFKEVMNYRMEQLDLIRLEMMEAAEGRRNRKNAISFFVEMICLPHLKIWQKTAGYTYAAFLCEYLPIYQPMAMHMSLASIRPEVAAIKKIIQELQVHLHHLPSSTFDRRITSATLLFLNSLRGLSKVSANAPTVRAEDPVIRDAIRQAVAVLSAPYEP